MVVVFWFIWLVGCYFGLLYCVCCLAWFSCLAFVLWFVCCMFACFWIYVCNSVVVNRLDYVSVFLCCVWCYFWIGYLICLCCGLVFRWYYLLCVFCFVFDVVCYGCLLVKLVFGCLLVIVCLCKLVLFGLWVDLIIWLIAVNCCFGVGIRQILGVALLCCFYCGGRLLLCGWVCSLWLDISYVFDCLFAMLVVWVGVFCVCV